MPKEVFSQRPVEALYDALVPVDVNLTGPNLDRVLCQQLTDGAHELAPRVNLKELRPPQGTQLVNPSKAIGNLCRSLASQGLSLFVAAGDLKDRESITEEFRRVQEEQVCLMDLIWCRHVKFRLWYVSWSRQIVLPDGLLHEPVLGLLLSHLCCRRQIFYGCEPLPVTSESYERFYNNTPSAIKPLGLRILPLLEQANISIKNVQPFSLPSKEPWTQNPPRVILDLHKNKKSEVDSHIFLKLNF